MQISKNKTVLALLFLAVIVSGCTGGNQEEESTTTSVDVMEFSAFPNPTPAGQNTRFRMQLQNNGEADAQNAYARLYNPPFGTGSQTWSTTSGNEPSVADRTLEFGTLRAAGEQTPAVPKTDTVNLEAPDLEQGRDVDYTFKSYMMFNYSTTATAEIRIMGEDAYREAGSPSGTASLENSAGPVQMEIRTPTPITVYDTSSLPIEKQLCIIVRNQGSGTPFAPYNPSEDSVEGYNVSKVQERTDNLTIQIQDVGDVTFAPNDGSNKKQVQILGGKGVACYDMEIANAGGTLEQTVPIRIDAVYGYRKSSRANVMVEGQ